MRLKTTKNKTKSFRFRMTESEFNQIKCKAMLYCEGNMSEFILYSSINFVPSKEDFEEPEIKKGRKSRPLVKHKG